MTGKAALGLDLTHMIRELFLVHRVSEWVKINGGLPPMDGASLL